MATVSLANLAADFNVTSPLPGLVNGAGGPATYTWTYTGLRLVFTGTFTYGGGGQGPISTFQADLGNNATYDLTISDLSANLSGFYGASQSASALWSTVLGGADTIDLGANTSTNGFTITLAGDGGDVLAGSVYTGRNDTITGDSGSGTISGDYSTVKTGASAFGGNDTIEVSAAVVNGDAWYVETGGYLIGGDDALNTSAEATVSFLVGDVDYVYGVVVGGDDTLTAAHADSAYGDAYYVEGRLYGGDDLIFGGSTAATLVGDSDILAASGWLRAGNDSIYGGSGDDLIAGDVRFDYGGTLIGGDDLLYGNGGNDTIHGNGGNDSLHGGAGLDELYGEDGDDHFYLHTGSELVSGEIIDGGDGDDSLHFGGDGRSYDYDLSGGTFTILSIEELVFDKVNFGTATVQLKASSISSGLIAFDATVTGNSAANVADTLRFVMGDTTDFAAAASFLRLRNFDDPLDKIVIDGDGDGERMAGTGYNDSISGNGGVDTLLGSAGRDTLRGGSGNDVLSTSPDLITAGSIFDGGTDTDTLIISGYAPGVADLRTVNLISIEKLILLEEGTVQILASQVGSQPGSGLSSSATIQAAATNRESSDTLEITVGSSSSVDLSRFSFIDFVASQQDRIVVQGGTVAASIVGSSINDSITGSAFNDTIRGGAGADTLNGGNGTGDVLDYSDRAQSIVYTIGAADVRVDGVNEDRVSNFEGIIGGSKADTFYGNAAANLLSGGAGNDFLRGGGGSDTLNGGANTDTADFADKGTGLAVTLVNGAATVKVSASETDTLTGIENVNGGSSHDRLTGDAGANLLAGNSGNDTLRGGLGNDTLNGGAGVDTADFADKSSAVVATLASGGGTVTISATDRDTLIGIENLIGGSAGDALTGDTARNLLVGNGGKDTLNGGLGADTLTGSAGNDKFVFNSKLGAGNIDTITDFKHNGDLLQLNDSIFRKIGSSLSSGEFYAKKGATAAHDKDDRILYDTKSGKLYYDDDGKGGHAAIHFATLTNKPLLDHGDFSIV